MAGTTTPPLETRAMAAREDELRSFQECFAANGASKLMDVLVWQYLDNPGGDPLVDFSVNRNGEREEVAGIYAVFPVTMRAGGRTVPAAQSIDTITMPAYRGRGIFTTLAASVYARAKELGVGFVYGFPNGNSAHGFFAKLDWQTLDPVPFLVRPMRTRYVLARVPRLGRALRALPDVRLPLPRAPRLRPGEELSSLTEFGAEFDDLWARVEGQFPVAVRRDAAYLTWRFAKPREDYRTAVVRAEGRLLGFVTWCVKDKHGGRIGYLMELLVDPAHPHLADALLRPGGWRGWANGRSTRPARRRAAGFVPLPERLRPIELHLGVLVLDEALGPQLRRRESWYLSYCDSDTV